VELNLANGSRNIVVRKPVGTTHFRNVYNATERKMLNCVFWNASESGLEKPLHRIQEETLRALIGIGKTRNSEWLRQLSRSLVSSLVEWNSIGKDKSVEWSHCTALSMGRFRNGYYEYRINPELLEQLKEPNLWGQFRLLAQVNITKKHTLPIYEFLSTEMALAKVKEAAVSLPVPVVDIREICGIPDAQYPLFKDFNRYVLAPSIKEINKETDLLVETKNISQKGGKGKKIVQIEFTMQRKNSFQYALPGFDELINARVQAKSIITDDMKKLIEKLQNSGVSKSAATRLAKKYSEIRISRNISYAVEQAKKNEINNIGAYVVKAIEGDYKPGPSAKDIEAQEAAQEARAKRLAEEAKAKKAKAIEAEFADFQLQTTKDKIADYSASWLRKKRKEYAATISDNDKLQRPLIEQGEWDNAIVQAGFNRWIRHQILTDPHETSIEGYTKWKRSGGNST